MRRLLFILLLGTTSGCALLTKSDPVVPRYFTPETSDRAGVPPNPTETGPTVRIGRVGGGSYLKERIAYRNSDHEFGFYEDRRWTERPEVYLQRALERSLFEARGLRRALAVTAPTLTVDLVEFEELRGAAPGVRVRVSYALHDERTVYREASFAIERRLPGGTAADQPERVAATLGDAMREAVERIGDEVTGALRSRVVASRGEPDPPTTR